MAVAGKETKPCDHFPEQNTIANRPIKGRGGASFQVLKILPRQLGALSLLQDLWDGAAQAKQ